MSDTELNPCPFCGGASSIRSGAPGCHFVQCDTCNATSDDGSKERIIAAWNRRADFDARIRSALVERKAEPEECEKCVGTGTVEDAGKPIGMGGFMKCPECNGTGYTPPAEPVTVEGEAVEAMVLSLRDAFPSGSLSRSGDIDYWRETMRHALRAALSASPSPVDSRDALERAAVADQIVGQIEDRFPNWRSYRDLIDCIDCTLAELRKGAAR